MDTRLPSWRRVLVVVAHPDDESFGLGAIIDGFVRAGAAVDVLCLTRGEASTLGDREGLADLRRAELEAAGAALGVNTSALLDHPDGGLTALVEDLAAVVDAHLEERPPDGVLVFDVVGVTGHPVHAAATSAAMRAAGPRALPVLGWALPASVAEAMNTELGTAMSGYPEGDLDARVVVDRAAQKVAIAAHASQAVPGSPLWRRLDLLGDVEWLRWQR